jgi:hypothetical protein
MSIARTRQSRLQYAVRVTAGGAGTQTLPDGAGETVTVAFSGVPSRGLIRRVAIVAVSSNSSGAVANLPRTYDSVYLHYVGEAGLNKRSTAYVPTIFSQLAYDQQNRNTLAGYSLGQTGSSNNRFVSAVDCVPVNCGGIGDGGFYNVPHAVGATGALAFPTSAATTSAVIEGSTVRTTSGVFPAGGIFYDTQSPLIAGVTTIVEGPNFTENTTLYLTLLSEGFDYDDDMQDLTFIMDIEPTH